MADYYDECSVKIECVSSEGRKFLISLLNAQEQPEDVPDDKWDSELEVDAASYEELDGNNLWIYSEERINIDRVADAIAQYQSKFDDAKPVVLTWASYCSKPRVGEQGGGAAVVYKGESHLMNVWDWAAGKLNELQAV